MNTTHNNIDNFSIIISSTIEYAYRVTNILCIIGYTHIVLCACYSSKYWQHGFPIT